MVLYYTSLSRELKSNKNGPVSLASKIGCDKDLTPWPFDAWNMVSLSFLCIKVWNGFHIDNTYNCFSYLIYIDDFVPFHVGIGRRKYTNKKPQELLGVRVFRWPTKPTDATVGPKTSWGFYDAPVIWRHGPGEEKMEGWMIWMRSQIQGDLLFALGIP